MNFTDALDYINNGNHLTYMTRDEWPFYLYFCPDSGYLMMRATDRNETILTPYVISFHDLEEEWEIFNP